MTLHKRKLEIPHFPYKSQTHRLIFFCWWLRAWIELLETLFGLEPTWFGLFNPFGFARFDSVASLTVVRKLFETITRDAPSKRSFSRSPTTRKLGRRIQQVFTVHEPDIPWHLHSCRISDCTCWKREREDIDIINRWKIIYDRGDLNREEDGRALCRVRPFWGALTSHVSPGSEPQNRSQSRSTNQQGSLLQ